MALPHIHCLFSPARSLYIAPSLHAFHDYHETELSIVAAVAAVVVVRTEMLLNLPRCASRIGTYNRIDLETLSQCSYGLPHTPPGGSYGTLGPQANPRASPTCGRPRSAFEVVASIWSLQEQ